METFLANFSEVHRILTYLFIFLGIFVEGEIILIVSGVLVRAGSIDFFDTLAVAFCGTIAHDITYWYIGKLFFASKKEKFLFLNLKRLGPFLARIHKNNSYIFTSKFTWAFNRLVLIASGYENMPVRRLLNYVIPAAFLWVTTLVALGYVFAHKTHILRKDIRTVILSITVFVVVLFIFENIFQKTLIFKGKNGVEDEE